MFRTSQPFQKTLNLLGNRRPGTEWAKAAAEAAVDHVPGLERRAVNIEISGNEHETKKADGTVDPSHVSGVLYSASRRLVSFHAYRDGLVRFSQAKYGEVRVSAADPAPVQASSSEGQATIEASTPAAVNPHLSWQVTNNVPEYWDGTQWVPAQYVHAHRRWMYHYMGTWHYYGN